MEKRLLIIEADGMHQSLKHIKVVDRKSRLELTINTEKNALGGVEKPEKQSRVVFCMAEDVCMNLYCVNDSKVWNIMENETSERR